MRRARFLCGSAGALLMSATALAAPVRIIFDTDMDSDCDDVAALAMLHALADKGEAEILGTMVSSKEPWAAPCTDAINTYYGRPDLPVGIPKGRGPRLQGSKYARGIAAEFPHDTPAGEAAPDATRLYREILAREADGAVTIVTVGDLTNLRYLLESPGDDLSPLNGRELIAMKVNHWVCMGSRYPADLDPKPWGNFKPDPVSTVKAVEDWPGLITFTGGGKLAESLATGAELASLPATNPVRRGYELYFGGTCKDRHSADQIATYIAVRGTGAPWLLVTSGRNRIFPNGTHQWEEAPEDPNHQYISSLLNPQSAPTTARAIAELMSHAPAKPGGPVPRAASAE